MWNILIPVIVAIVVGFVAFIAGFLYRKSVSEKTIGSAEMEATRIVNEAIKTADTKKKEAMQGESLDQRLAYLREKKGKIHKGKAEKHED